MVVFVCCSGFVGWNQNKTAIIRRFFCILLARIRNYTSLKASARWKALILLASSWCLSSWMGLRRRRWRRWRRWLKTTASPTQLSTSFQFSLPWFLLASSWFWFCVAFGQNLYLSLKTGGKFYAWYIESNRNVRGSHFPLVEFRSLVFSRMSTSPRCFWIWTGSPFGSRLYIAIFSPFVWLWVSFVLVRLCFVGK